MPKNRLSLLAVPFLFLLLGTILFNSCANAADKGGLPHNWPWKGMVLVSHDSLPADIAVLKKTLGINCVSLQLKPRLRCKWDHVTPDTAWKRELAWAKSMLQACKKSDVVGVLVIYQFPFNPKLDFIQDSPKFWNDPKQLDDVIKKVEELAAYFKDSGQELGAYEILSEPLLREGRKVSVPRQWPGFRERIVTTLRKQDPQRWIMVAPGPGALPGGYKAMHKLDHERIIYSAHMYIPHDYTHQGIGKRKRGLTYPGYVGKRHWDRQALENALAPLRNFQKKNNVPVWIGEFSAVRWADGAEQYVIDVADIFDSYGWSWAYHTYGGYHGWNPDYDSLYASDKKEDWSKHFTGLKSPRWKTLKKIFKVQ